MSSTTAGACAGDFWFTHANSDILAANSDPTVNVMTPATGEPKPPAVPEFLPRALPLAAGIGTDIFSITRTYDFKVADLEVVKECNIFDVFMMFGAGARYAVMTQGYNAARSNGGGTNPNTGTVVTLDQENLALQSQFEGIGPTVSFEMVHPIHGTCFSLYGSVRGSFLFGVERYQENYSLNNATAPGGVAAPTVNTVYSNENTYSRMVPALDLEGGLQVGWRCGHCYLFGRIGGIFSRWWDVGSPLGSTGNLDIVGGTLKLGIIY